MSQCSHGASGSLSRATGSRHLPSPAIIHGGGSGFSNAWFLPRNVSAGCEEEKEEKKKVSDSLTTPRNDVLGLQRVPRHVGFDKQSRNAKQQKQQQQSSACFLTEKLFLV